MKTTFKVEGLKELDAALAELPRATGKNVLRRVARKSLEPLAADMKARAPDDPKTGGMDLKNSIGVGTRLTKRQAKLHRKMFRDDKASVEAFAGAGNVPHAHLQEFGAAHHGPQPFARPAYDAWKGTAVPNIATDLAAEIDKAAKRLQRKAARLARKG